MPPTNNLFDVTGPTFQFNGGTVTVKIRAPHGPIDPYVQGYTFISHQELKDEGGGRKGGEA